MCNKKTWAGMSDVAKNDVDSKARLQKQKQQQNEDSRDPEVTKWTCVNKKRELQLNAAEPSCVVL